jgi:hypothetical protein
MELSRFFERAMRASFGDLGIGDDSAARYLAGMLTRFARTEHLFPGGAARARLETVVDMLIEAQEAWLTSGRDEISVRRHIGDYTLFMTGVFPEHVERIASSRFYAQQGREAYRFVFEHDRAAGRASAPLYRRLAERFEHYAGALDYARRVHFPEHSELPFFRFRSE